MNKFKTFLSNYSVSIGACVLMVAILGIWHVFASPTKTTIGDNVHVVGGLNVVGNVGIGTTSPGVALDVVGKISARHSGDNSYFTVQGDWNRQTGIIISKSSSTAGTTTDPRWVIYQGGNTDTLYFYGNSGESAVSAMTLLTNGNVGIGTTNPQAKLDVDGGDNSFAWGGDHSGTGYIRIGDLQIVWGSTSITGQGTYENSKTITYPASFSSTPLVTTTMQDAYRGGSAQWSTNAHAVTTSGARLSLAYWNGAYSGTYTVAYIAIGTWQ
jgi:hypothetical protein